MRAGADPLLHHIRHAEEWLGRARLDWRRGNAPAAMLRLMLAEAEIRHARERGVEAQTVPAESPAAMNPTPAGPRRAAWPKAAAAIAAAAVLAAGLGYASTRPAAVRDTALVERTGPGAGLRESVSRTIVRLDSGEFLMPNREQTAGSGPGSPGPSAGDIRRLQFAVPVDLKTPSPSF